MAQSCQITFQGILWTRINTGLLLCCELYLQCKIVFFVGILWINRLSDCCTFYCQPHGKLYKAGPDEKHDCNISLGWCIQTLRNFVQQIRKQTHSHRWVAFGCDSQSFRWYSVDEVCWNFFKSKLLWFNQATCGTVTSGHQWSRAKNKLANIKRIKRLQRCN